MTMTEPVAPSAQADTVHGELDSAARTRLDRMIAELGVAEKKWAKTSLPERATLLGQLHKSVAGAAAHWAKAASEIKGLDPRSQLVGEEWISGPYPVLTAAATLAQTMTTLASGASPLAGKKFGTAPGNRVTIPVLPGNAYEAILLHGFSAEVWLAPGVTAQQAKDRAGLGSLHPEQTDGVGLVLGAGNITSIPPLDVLYELFAHNRVVVLKLNPVMEKMLAVYQTALGPLIKRGVLRIVTGGADVGSYLAHHPGISHVHITGSSVTHDVVVWGPGQAGRDRKAANTPLLEKPMTSELGGVSPIIIVPGNWSSADLIYQAEHVATQRLHNGGYNCIAGQIVVLSKDWKQKDAFLRALRSALDRTPGRKAWYPGSDDRLEAAAAAYPKAERFGVGGTRLLVDIHADEDPSTIESIECFAPVLGVVELAGTGAAFLASAVDTVNRDFLGTLGANVLVDPKTRKQLGSAFRESIAALRYGTIAINAWTGVGYLTAAAPWGAFPGHTLDNVQSGIGTVHNALLIDSPERSVVTGPFRPFPRSFAGGEFALFPKPPWFVTSRSAQVTGRRLVGFASKPGWLRMPAVFAAAFRA
jgi:acyl-CoA reductase-like NAD-dependent aldehyde dehydrogenase